jgi:hypothetical protein
MENPLDNPVWHALTGPHAAVALGAGAARHYPREAAPFSAISVATPAAYADLAHELPPGLRRGCSAGSRRRRHPAGRS